MLNKYIVVIVSSAGGLKALSKVLSGLPEDFPSPIAIVQHLDPRYPSQLAAILQRHTVLAVKQAAVGDELKAGIVYIAPPDQHLLVNPDHTFSLSHTEKVRHVRPAGDVLFKSAAVNYKEKVIAVVLTGMDSDGAEGIKAIKDVGGIVIAQDEATSEFFSMPQAAIKTGAVDLILPLDAIAPTLVNLVNK